MYDDPSAPLGKAYWPAFVALIVIAILLFAWLS